MSTDNKADLRGWNLPKEDWEYIRAIPDSDGGYCLAVGTPDGSANNNITSDTVVKTGKGTIDRVSVKEASLATGAIHDAASVAEANATNLIAIIPVAIGPIVLNWPVTAGIVVKPGSGQKLAISYR